MNRQKKVEMIIGFALGVIIVIGFSILPLISQLVQQSIFADEKQKLSSEINFITSNNESDENLELDVKNEMKGMNTNIPFAANSNPTQKSHSQIEYTGIGQELSVLHESNRTDSQVPLSFPNGTNTGYNIPIGEGWNAHQIEVNLTNLQDYKNWVNGSFNYGTSDSAFVNTYANAINANDTLAIQNAFQNWTFSRFDNTVHINRFSGNYYDASTAAGRNSLELLIAGNDGTSGYYAYSNGDQSKWTSQFNVPRGAASDAILKFQVNPYRVAEFNSWELRVRINNLLVYSMGVQSLASTFGSQNWGNIVIPMGLWSNNSQVFPSSLDAVSHSISFELIYVATNAQYSSSFSNISYQQILIANVELYIKAEVRSDQIGLTYGGTPLISSQYGFASLLKTGAWIYPSAALTFSAVNNETNTVSFISSFNIYATKTSPTSFYTTNFNAQGTKFSILPTGNVNWEFYIYFSVPIGYREYNFTLTFPTDWMINWVSSPQLPGTNQLGNVDNSIPGLLKIPVKDISETPDGFWRFQATSPNYLHDLELYINTTTNPGATDWTSQSVFFPGEYLNISARLNTSLAFTNFAGTIAELNILFPNGSLWQDQTQFFVISSDGRINFEPVQIPIGGPAYLVGEYAILIRWNNSIGGNDLNETGVLQNSFIVKHLSQTNPDQAYFEKILEGTLVSIRVNYLDLFAGAAIENGIVNVINFQNQYQTLTEIAPGYYFTQIDVSGVSKGNNTLTITGSHPLYANSSTVITIEAILPVRLIALESPGLTVPWNKNFKITLNYTEQFSGFGIENAAFTILWFSNYDITDLGNGLYEVFLNNSVNSENKYWSLEITSNTYGYQSAVIFLDIVIAARTTELQIFLQGTNATINSAIEVPYGTNLNLTTWYLDKSTQGILQNADFQLKGAIVSGDYEKIADPNRGVFLINTTRLGLGVHYISVTAELWYYEPLSRIIQITVREMNTLINTTTGIFTYSIFPTDDLLIEFDLLSTDFNMHLSGATFTYFGALSSGTVSYNSTSKKYYFSIENVPEGTHTLTISGYLGAEYRINPIQIIISAWGLPVKLIALESPGLTVPWNDDFSITLNLTEKDSGLGISKANFNILWFANYQVTEIGNGLYSVFLNNSVNSENRYWRIEITSDAYGYQSALIFLDIVIGLRKTDLQIFLQGENATINSAIEIPYGTQLNLTIFYLDRVTQIALQNGNYALRGAITTGQYLIVSDIGRGIFIINTTKLGLGVHYLSVVVDLPFHEPNSRTIEITVRQIHTVINTTIGSFTYAITPKENLLVEFDLLNSDFGGRLLGATFTYSSLLGSGELQFNATSQHYYFLLESIPEGTHTITISGYLGPEYRITTIQLIIVAAYPEITPTVPSWVLWTGGIVLAGLSVAFIGYLTVWKYPKIVRTLRSLQHVISSGKMMKMHLKSSRDLFVQSYLNANQPFGHHMADKNKLI
jgi:hypothetical protein